MRQMMAVSRWPLWNLPCWLGALVAFVAAAYAAALGVAATVTPVRPGQLGLFGLLVACGAAAVEMTRRTGEPTGVTRDVYAVWDLPAAVLLPPLYALLAPVPRMVLTQLRVRRGILHRRVYSAAAVGLAYAATSLAFHAAAPVLLAPGAGAGTGRHALLWTVLAAGCGLLRLVINDGLVLAAVKGSAPQTRLLPEVAGAEAVHGNVAELALGTLVAFAAAHSVLAVLWAVPLVISLQRSLRHAQLVREARTDGKTGLLNDTAWRREAAGEVARAARTSTPVAVGILDIDHFKAVNDTHGHLAGDAVLAAVAAATRALLRDYDLVGRVGGEEFAFVLPHTPPDEAAEVAQRLRAAIPQIPIPRPDPGTTVPSGVTVSIGVAAADQPRGDLAAYLTLADRALYTAKRQGRDRVRVVRPPGAEPGGREHAGLGDGGPATRR